MITSELPLPYKRFEELARFQEPYCVSIYLPMYKTGKEQNQGLGPAQLRSALEQAERHLNSLGMPAMEVEAYVSPVKDLIADLGFWRYPSEGLAIFLDRHNGLSLNKLPLGFSPLVYVADHFYIVPLLPLFEFDNRIFLLQLSQDYVKLFQGDPYQMEEVHISDMIPGQLEETVGFDYKQKMLQFRTGHATHGAGSFHGHGEGKDDDRKEVLSFLRKIEKSIKKTLQAENIPLVLGCVDELYPLYKQVNTYSQLYPEHISGDPETKDKNQWAIEIRNLILNKNKASKKAYCDEYDEFIHTPKTSHQISEIIPAAVSGKIELLFLKKGAMVYGTFNIKNNCVILDSEKTPKNRCLVNFAAVNTILQGGNIYSMENEMMPEENRPLNALYRY
ncbi:MAG: hypothetical protein WBN59_11555 [Flavobacteriaceae bacterium]